MILAPFRNQLRSSLVILAGLLLCGGSLLAQNPAGAGTPSSKPLPDSPELKQQDTNAPSVPEAFIGYMTNRSFVFPDIAHNPGPLSTGGKFRLFVNQSISPPYIIAAGISAAYSQARNVPSAYGQGWDAYGSRFGAAVARASSSSFFGTFIFASAFHQDPRFFPQVRPTLWGSIKYSAERLVSTRNDAGKDAVNYAGLMGPAASEALANVYLPVSEQTAGKTAERYGTDMAWRFAGNMFKNYWPVVFKEMGLNRLKVIPNPNTNP